MGKLILQSYYKEVNSKPQNKNEMEPPPTIYVATNSSIK